MRGFILRFSLPFLALAALATPADGGLIVTQMDTSTPIMTFTIPSRGVNGESGYVGPNTVSLGGGAAVQAYCTDLFRSIGIDDHYPGSVHPLSSLPGGNLVARLFSADAALGGSTPEDKAALQLAIWDVVEFSRLGLGPLDPLKVGSLNKTEYKINGVLDITAGSVSLVTIMDRVSSLLNLAPSLPGTRLTFFGTDTDYGQGFVSVAPVPEPSTILSASIAGLIGLGYAWRRRRARVAA